MRALPILLAGAVLLSACEDSPSADGFPRGFLWGTAVAGFQVDMGCPTLPAEQCEDRNSDWYAWVSTPSLQEDETTHLSGQPVSIGPGHWELYAEDYARARNELHNNAHRLSIEWSRIFPAPTFGIEGHDALKAIANASAIEHYHQQFASLKTHGLKPLVTLNHYTLPSWIHDAVGCHQDLSTCSPKGWVDRETTVREIAKYAGFVAREFGAEVDLWATLNEPMAVVLPGYIYPSAERTNPPGVMLNSEAAKIVMQALIEAHARMYDAVREEDTQDADGNGKPAEIGLVYAMVPVKGKDDANTLDQIAARNVFYLYNSAFLNAVIKGDFDPKLDRKTVHRDDLAGRMDWLGINYYTRVTVQGTQEPFLPELSPLTNFNPLEVSPWENYPQGLYEMAMEVKQKYGLPMYVSENGTADVPNAEIGIQYLTSHLTALQQAVREGADVRGYFWWSLIDNYEWNHGMNMRFGMFAVDETDPAKPRTARPIAEVYRRIATDNRL